MEISTNVSAQQFLERYAQSRDFSSADSARANSVQATSAQAKWPTRVAEEVSLSALNQQVSVFERQQFELQLTTVEGDQVSISYSAQASLQQSQRTDTLALGGSTTKQLETASQASQSSQINVVVRGDLNQQEQQAIDSLLQGIQETVDSFVSNEQLDIADLQQRFAEVPSVLSDYALSLAVEQQVSVIETYQQVAQPVEPSKFAPEIELLDQLSRFGQAQKSLIEAAKAQFDDASAASLVRNTVPAYLQQALLSY